MRILSAGITDRGLKRELNEDTFLVDEDLGVYLVCDGLGGHSAGEVASRETAQAVAAYLRSRRQQIEEANQTPDGHFNLLKLVEKAVQEACAHVHKLASSQSQYAGMGTTLTMALVVDGKSVMAHVGDCRLYILRRGRVHLMSSDHTMANELIQLGQLDPEKAQGTRWTHALTRSIGNQSSVQVDTLLFDLFPGDTCLLCSDGLSCYLKDTDEVRAYLTDDRVEDIPGKLVQLAHSGGAHDNITAVVFRADGETTAEKRSTEEIERQLAVLRSTFFLEGLSLSQLIRIRNSAVARRFAKGENMVAEGQHCAGLHILDRGRAAIIKDGERVKEVKEGEEFGETSLLRAMPARASVLALESCEVLLITREELQSIVRKSPRLGRRIQSNLLRRLCDQLDSLASEEADGSSATALF